ncbi:MAG TPA: hypothetical protein VHO43_14885, partial [Ignavibacteriales bacterium]|nr:hypothetical protein [Ignavibacteriales bacterium]
MLIFHRHSEHLCIIIPVNHASVFLPPFKKLNPDKEIFPLLINTLTDTLDISSIAEGIKKMNGIAWLAI